MTIALAARRYTLDAIRFLAWTMYNDEAKIADRVAAAKLLLDRGHGKPQQSTELLEPVMLEEENYTLEEIQAEIKRRGLDKIINLIPNDDQDRLPKQDCD